MFKTVRKYYSMSVRAAAVVDGLFEAVADDLPFERGDEVALMINGLGGTPLSELYLLYRRATIRAMDRSVKVIRNSGIQVAGSQSCYGAQGQRFQPALLDQPRQTG